MKSDVIRKRARHDARRSSGNVSETPSASPGASRRASPVDGTGNMGDLSAQLGNEDQHELSQTSSSELMGALGNQGPQGVQVSNESAFNFYSLSYTGPYHPDYITQLNSVSSDARTGVPTTATTPPCRPSGLALRTLAPLVCAVPTPTACALPHAYAHPGTSLLVPCLLPLLWFSPFISEHLASSYDHSPHEDSVHPLDVLQGSGGLTYAYRTVSPPRCHAKHRRPCWNTSE